MYSIFSVGFSYPDPICFNLFYLILLLSCSCLLSISLSPPAYFERKSFSTLSAANSTQSTANLVNIQQKFPISWGFLTGNYFLNDASYGIINLCSMYVIDTDQWKKVRSLMCGFSCLAVWRIENVWKFGQPSWLYCNPSAHERSYTRTSTLQSKGLTEA